MPPDSAAMHFMLAAGPTHWMHVVGVFQVIGGLLVLSGGAAPLGLALLAPVLVNILAFHALLMNGEGLAPGLVFSSLEGFLIYGYRAHFAGLLTTKARPSA